MFDETVAILVMALIITWCLSLIIQDITRRYGRHIRASYRRMFK